MASNEVKLQAIESICSTLDNILIKSFGPNALTVLLASSSNKMMVTSAGMPVLESLHISHPVGQMLIRYIQSHYQMVGDNSKTFLLLLSEMLKSIVRKLSKEQNIERMKYCKCLHSLRNHILPQEILPRLIERCKESLTSPLDIRDRMSELVNTHFQGKFNQTTREHFTNILTTYITEAYDYDHMKLQDVLQYVIDNFSLIFHENTGLSQLSTCIVQGVIITRDVMKNKGDIKMENVKFILMDCSLETDDPDGVQNQDLVFSGLTQSNLQKAFMWKQKRVKLYIKKLVEKGVQLLLTTTHVSDLELHLCDASGIRVMQCVDEEEMTLLSGISNVRIVYESLELLTGDLDWYLGRADTCQHVNVAGRRYIQLVNPRPDSNSHQGSSNGVSSSISFPPDHQCPLNKVQSVLVCGPTPGICSQYKSAMYNAIKCLSMWNDPIRVLQSDNPLDNTTHTSVSTYSSTGEGALLLNAEQVVGYSVCGGGAFELFVFEELKEYTKTNYNADLNEVLGIVCDSLLAVPLRLLQNSYSPSATRMNIAQLLKLVRLPSATDGSAAEHGNESASKGDVALVQIDDSKAKETKTSSSGPTRTDMNGVNGKTGTSLIQSDSGIVHPLASKVLSLYNVLDTLQQVLRIDSIVSVSKVCEKTTSSSDTDM